MQTYSRKQRRLQANVEKRININNNHKTIATIGSINTTSSTIMTTTTATPTTVSTIWQMVLRQRKITTTGTNRFTAVHYMNREKHKNVIYNYITRRYYTLIAVCNSTLYSLQRLST